MDSLITKQRMTMTHEQAMTIIIAMICSCLIGIGIGGSIVRWQYDKRKVDINDAYKSDSDLYFDSVFHRIDEMKVWQDSVINVLKVRP